MHWHPLSGPQLDRKAFNFPTSGIWLIDKNCWGSPLWMEIAVVGEHERWMRIRGGIDDPSASLANMLYTAFQNMTSDNVCGI